MQIDQRIEQVIEIQPYPLLFVTISGAHLYGFPSPDSDYDLRGVHILPVWGDVGLEPGTDTIETSRVVDGLEIDFVTHDVKKFLRLLLKKNGYVLEQLLSPLVVRTSPAHEVLKELAASCITRHHSHHYFGFARTQWDLFAKEQPRRVKPLLYVYRVLLTGIHLMRTGQVEANLLRLNEQFRLPYIPELIERKLQGPEQSTLNDADVGFHDREYERLCGQLQAAFEKTSLPEAPSARDALNEFLRLMRSGSAWSCGDASTVATGRPADAGCPVCGYPKDQTVSPPCPRCWWQAHTQGGDDVRNGLSLRQARDAWQTAVRKGQP